MTKILKILARLVGISLEVVLLVLIFFAFGIRTSAFQTFLGKQATAYLSSELDADIRIGKVEIVFINKVLLQDVYVEDRTRDTLASIGTILATLDDYDLDKQKFVLGNALIEKGTISLFRDSLTGDYNYQFLADYFSSSDSSTSDSEPPKIIVKSIDLKKINFAYNDYRKSYSDYGMDFDHLDFKNVYLSASDFSSNAGILKTTIKHFSAKEKCGFSLYKLSTKCKIDPDKGLFLKNLIIRTSRSKIYASKLNLISKPMSGFNSFEDSVTFDARIDSSQVNMHDISLFAPTLKGMNDLVYLEADVSRKIKNLRISDLDLRFGKRSVVRGEINLPDFRDLDKAYFKEQLDYCLVDINDLKNFRLPDNAGKHIELDEQIEQLAYVDLRNTSFKGSISDFALRTDQIKTAMGRVSIASGMNFSALDAGGYAFTGVDGTKFDVVVDSFQLGKFAKEDLLGGVKGAFDLTGVVGQKDGFRLENFNGDIDYFGLNGYTYQNITVTDGSFKDNVVEAVALVDDPHLDLEYSGKIDLDIMKFTDVAVNIPKADLGKLNLSKDPNAFFTANVNHVNITGTDPQTMSGDIHIENIEYRENNEIVSIPSVDVKIIRGIEDEIYITSNVLEATMKGKVDFNTFPIAFNNMIAEVVPAYVSKLPFPKGKEDNNDFSLSAKTGDLSHVLAIYAPEIRIAEGSKFDMYYNGKEKQNRVDFISNNLSYGEVGEINRYFLDGIVLHQYFDGTTDSISLFATKGHITDSLEVENLNLNIEGVANKFDTHIDWNTNTAYSSEFNFSTTLKDNKDIFIGVEPSSFAIKDKQWGILNPALIVIAGDRFEIAQLDIERANQKIIVDGMVSRDLNDILGVKTENVQLGEISHLLNLGFDIQGELNSNVSLKNLYDSPMIDGEMNISQLFFEGNKVGDIHTFAIWNNYKECLTLMGDLKYELSDKKNFEFVGNIYPLREHNNLDLDLLFDKMDLQFANAFMDPSVVSGITGKIDGEIKVVGDFAEPKINGDLKLLDGKAKVEILGVTYTANGPIQFDGDNGFIIAQLPIRDPEGNYAYADASISHDNFSNFNVSMDFYFDELVNDFVNHVKGTFKQSYNTGRFMALNTQYKEGDVYYGKAYASGFANISIDDIKTAITVNARTERGTKIDLPMYGSRTVGENKWINWLPIDSSKMNKAVDLTGVELALNIDVTEDADLRLIFNEKTNDIITAKGKSTKQFDIKINQRNDITMDGEYTITDGVYNLSMYGISEKFIIGEGSKVSWTGNPEEAIMDIKTYADIKANISELNPLETSNQPVQCILNITEKLSKPKVALDITVPNLPENGKALLASIKNNEDELTKHFFTLLALRRFASLSGETTGGNTGAVADLLEKKLNETLGLEDYQFDFGSGQNKIKYMKSIGKNERLVLKTSAGVGSSKIEGQNQSSFVGDLVLQYLINESGTFKAFYQVQTNDKSAITNTDRGPATQSVGLSYSEEFNNMEDSRVIEVVKNVFSENNVVKNSKSKNEEPIPTDEKGNFIIPTDEGKKKK
ncbi:MAG: translocation/assembly module TamB domain-containing protein [Fluviicola sp.]